MYGRHLGIFEKRSRLLLCVAAVLIIFFIHNWHASNPPHPPYDAPPPRPIDIPPTANHGDTSFYRSPKEYEHERPKFAPPTDEFLDADWGVKSKTVDYAERPAIAKVSMLYGQEPRSSYVRALKSHRIHNKRFNYAMFVLEEDAVGGFWNKPLYLLSLLMQELSKPPSERLQWLMWVDADLILVNPSIPLEVFLPPTDLAEPIHFIGARDQNGLNTGTFFLRVSAWSVHMLNKALGMPFYETDIDLGNSFDQVAMQKVLQADHGAPEEAVPEDESPEAKANRLAKPSRPYIFQPREWHNTYEFEHGYEGGDASAGHLLVHFPGLEEKRWRHMDDWLLSIAKDPQRWDIPYDKSVYAKQIPEFWQLTRTSETLLHTLNHNLTQYYRTGMERVQLRGAMSFSEGLLTNASYSIGPGRDMLEEMQQGIDSLQRMMDHEFPPPETQFTMPSVPPPPEEFHSENERPEPPAQCICVGDCTNEELRRITSDPECQAWL